MAKKHINIYFCGSIRGGRNDQGLYREIIGYLKDFGTVLTEHIAEKEVVTDLHLSPVEIYERDINWLDESDYVIAEVSTPSLGVGVEIGRSVSRNKKILCLSQAAKHDNLSAMIKGCSDLELAVYSNIGEAKIAISNFLK